MSRKLINIPVAVAAFGILVVGSTIASSNIANSVGGGASMTKIDFDRASTGPTAMPHRESTPAIMTKVDFDQAFADAIAIPRRDNTPANREKLREVGWKRIIGSR